MDPLIGRRPVHGAGGRDPRPAARDDVDRRATAVTVTTSTDLRFGAVRVANATGPIGTRPGLRRAPSRPIGQWMPRRTPLPARMAVLLTCALAATAPAVAQEPRDTPPPPAERSATPAQLERALLAEMNRVRRARGRVALRQIAPLRRAARAQSRYLLRTGTLSHEGPDGSPFWTRLVAAGFPRNRHMGENLAMTSGCDPASARRTVAMWMASPGHRANLLNPVFRVTGTGVAIGAGCSETYLTADYGS